MAYGIRYDDLDPTLKEIIDSKANVNVANSSSLTYVYCEDNDGLITLPTINAPLTNVMHIITGSDINIEGIVVSCYYNGANRILALQTPDGRQLSKLKAGYHLIVIKNNTQAVVINTNGSPNVSGLGINPILMSGTGIFNGNDGVVITHNLNIPVTDYQVCVTPNDNGGGSIGEYHVEKSANSFKVVNTGDVTNKSFAYIVTLK